MKCFFNHQIQKSQRKLLSFKFKVFIQVLASQSLFDKMITKINSPK